MLEDDVFYLYVQAGRSDIEVQDLAKLAKHEHPLIRMRVAENPLSPVGVLVALASDPNPEVRCALSENPAIPMFIMDILAEDEHDDVRYWVADNPHTPIFVLGKLILDKNCYVASRARKWFETSRENAEIYNFNFARVESKTAKVAKTAG